MCAPRPPAAAQLTQDVLRVRVCADQLGRSRVVFQQAGGKEGTWLSCDLNTYACKPERAAPRQPAAKGAGFSQPPGLLEREQGKPRPVLPGPTRPLLSCPRETVPLRPQGAVWAGGSPGLQGALHAVLFLPALGWACLLRPPLPKPPSS